MERGADLHRVELDEGEPLPAARDFDAIVAMGGPMSVNDEVELPGSRGEALIGEAVRAGAPFWGVCLGVQLLASTLGARVYPGRRARGRPPPGRAHPRRAGPTPCSAGSPDGLVTLQWHGDTFDLPDGAVPPRRLARVSQPGFPGRQPRTACSSTSR